MLLSGYRFQNKMNLMNTLEIRFDIQLTKVENIISSCTNEKDKALCLFKKDLRTPFFMMEALSRMFGKLEFEKPFIKWEKRTKLLEDKLGMVDYAIWLKDECSKRKILTQDMTNYFNKMLQNALQDLTLVLDEGDWLNGQRIAKMRRKLRDLKGVSKADKKIKEFYLKQVDDLFSTHQDCTYQDIENDLHELRRKLRWLSIYAHALQGTVAMNETTEPSSVQKKYLNKKVVSSPFNILPQHNDIQACVYMDKNSFLVLNSVISQLGSLKDNGLLIVGLQKYFQDKKNLAHEKALQKSYKLLGLPSNGLEDIMKEGKSCANRFFSEDHLHHVIIQ